MSNLRTLSPISTEVIRKYDNEISIYSGSLNTDCIVSNTAKIKKAFPALPIDFFDVFTDRLKVNGFNDDRLRDAVDHVIDTCVYPTPTIAQFISFDKRYKIYTYEEMIGKSEEYGAKIWETYKSIKFPDRVKKGADLQKLIVNLIRNLIVNLNITYLKMKMKIEI